MRNANAGIAVRTVLHLRSYIASPRAAATAAPALGGPSWLPASCPPWCLGDHREAESYADRTHDSEDRSTRLSLAEPIEDDMPRIAAAALMQHYDDTEPRILFAHGERQDEAVYLTLDEAERIGRDLLALAAVGRAG